MSFPNTHTHSHIRTHLHTHAQSTDALRILIHTNPYLIRATPSSSSLTGNVWSGLVLQECVGSFAYFTLTGFSTGASRHDSIQFNPTQPDSTRLSSRQRQLNYVAVLITIRAAATRSYHSLTQANPCPPPLSLPPLLSSSSSSLSAASATSSVSIDAAALRRLLLLLLLSAPSVATCPRSLPASALSARERERRVGKAGVRGLFGPLFARCAAGGAVHRFRLANVVPRVVFGGLCLAGRLGTVGLALKCLPS